MTDTWHGLFGSYPIPEKFREVVDNRAAPAKRHQALRLVGEFYHWLHGQECREACKLAGMKRRQIQKANRAGRPPATSTEDKQCQKPSPPSAA